MMKAENQETHKMERPGIDVEETHHDQKLQQLFKNLQQEWNFIKKRPEKTLYRASTGSSKMIETLGLLDNSPRKLISPASEDVAWKVRTNDLAVQEILNERRAAIRSGRLKGRRLFEEAEGVTEVGFGRNEVPCSGAMEIGLVQEIEVMSSVLSYESDDYEDENCGRKEVLSPSFPHCSHSSSSSSSPCVENVERGGIKVATMAEKRIDCAVATGRRRWMVNNVWVAISLVVCIVGFISRRSFGVYEDAEEVILTPT